MKQLLDKINGKVLIAGTVVAGVVFFGMLIYGFASGIY